MRATASTNKPTPAHNDNARTKRFLFIRISLVLFPLRVEWFANQKSRVRAGARAELLCATTINFRDVKIAFLIDAHAMDAPEASGEIAPCSPRVKEVAVEIVLEHLRRSTIEGPQHPVGANIN